MGKKLKRRKGRFNKTILQLFKSKSKRGIGYYN